MVLGDLIFRSLWGSGNRFVGCEGPAKKGSESPSPNTKSPHPLKGYVGVRVQGLGLTLNSPPPTTPTNIKYSHYVMYSEILGVSNIKGGGGIHIRGGDYCWQKKSAAP